MSLWEQPRLRGPRSGQYASTGNAIGISILAQTHITISELFEEANVLRVELDGALEIFGRFSPPALPSIDEAQYFERQRFVRQTLLCHFEFLASVVVIEISPIQMFGEGEMRFA